MLSKSLPIRANCSVPESQDATLRIPAGAGVQDCSLLHGEKGISFGVQQERWERGFWC